MIAERENAVGVAAENSTAEGTTAQETTSEETTAEETTAEETTAELCPVCEDTQVRVVELGWFVLELDRGSELRDAHTEEDGPGLEFHCRTCGWSWT